MFWGILGLILGMIIGFLTKFTIPVEFARYTAVGIMAILDSVFGAAKAGLTDKTEKDGKKTDKYDPKIFISGLIFNTILATGITYLGDQLGIDLYLAVLVVFTIRIFMNMGIVRRSLLNKYLQKRQSNNEN